MVFTLPKNASQDLHLKNTVMGYRVELPIHMVLTGNDYKMVLASFTYSHTWYNMPDIAGQAYMATFIFSARPHGGRGQRWKFGKVSLPRQHFHQELQDTSLRYLRPSDKSFVINGHDIPTQLSQPQEPCPGDFQAWPERLPHSPIHAQERPSGQSVCALWPSGRCSCSGQCQELPIACSAHGGALLSGYVLQALVAGPAGQAAHVLDWTQGCAHAYDEQSWPYSAMWRRCVLGKTTDEAESKYIQIWKRERERERDMMMSITLYASAW